MGPASEQQLNQIAKRKDHPARLWLRAALADSVVSFAMVVIISSSFYILGIIVLQPQHRVPEGINLLNYQASFLTTLAPWLLPLYKTAIFLAFFGILYGGPELCHRVIYENINVVPHWRGRLPAGKIRAAVIVWVLGGAGVILWLSRSYPNVQLIDIFTPAGIYLGVLLSGFYALANPLMDRRFLPIPLRMPTGLGVLNLVAGVSFTVAGLKALWDYGQLNAYLTLAGVLLLCVFFASRMRCSEND